MLAKVPRKLEIIVLSDGKAARSSVNSAGRESIVPSRVIRRPFWSVMVEMSDVSHIAQSCLGDFRSSSRDDSCMLSDTMAYLSAY